MTEIILSTECENCGEDIKKGILDFTGNGVVDIDMMIEGDGFDCNSCGQNTSITLHKESF